MNMPKEEKEIFNTILKDMSALVLLCGRPIFNWSPSQIHQLLNMTFKDESRMKWTLDHWSYLYNFQFFIHVTCNSNVLPNSQLGYTRAHFVMKLPDPTFKFHPYQLRFNKDELPAAAPYTLIKLNKETEEICVI